MKIDNDSKVSLIDYLIRTKNTTGSEEASVKNRKEEKGITDRVELTRDAEFRRLKDIVKKAPSVREEKIATVKEAVEAKTYNIKGELVAKSLLKDHILETIL